VNKPRALSRDTGSMKSFPRAFILAPLVVPILYWAGAIAMALADANRRRVALQDPFAGFGSVLVVGGILAYAATLVASAPAIWLVRRAGGWTLVALLALGGIVGLIAAVIFGPYLRGDLFSIILPPLEGAVLGALSAGVFWWLAPRP
jgi:hypothetical protein